MEGDYEGYGSKAAAAAAIEARAMRGPSAQSDLGLGSIGGRAPRETPPLASLLQQQCIEVDALLNQLAQLEEKLQPVLEQVPMNTGKDGAYPSSSAPVLSVLQATIQKLTLAREIVASMQSRLVV